MSISTDITGAICTNLIQSVEALAGNASGAKKRSQTGVLDSLISNQNLTGGNVELVQVDQGNGHSRTVRVDYMQRRVDADVSATLLSGTCESTNDMVWNSETFTVSQTSQIDWRLTESYVSQLCGGGNAAQFANQLMRNWEALRRDVNANCIATIAANVGNHVSTGASATVNVDILDAANNDNINAGAYSQWMSDVINLNQFAGTPIVAAGGDFWRFNQLQGLGCCNDGGTDISGLKTAMQYDFFNDQQIDTELGDNRAFVYDPGSMQFVKFLRYRGSAQNALQSGNAYPGYEIVGSGTGRGILFDPYDDMPINFRVFFDECDERWTIELFLCYDVWTQPTAQFAAGDHLADTNGILDFTLRSN